MKALKLSLYMITIGASTMLSSCSLFSTQPIDGQFGPANVITGYRPVQEIQGSVDGKADILFVIDDSGSMGSVQARLASAFRGFTNNYLRQGVQVRIGVIKTSSYRHALEYPSLTSSNTTAVLRDQTFITTIEEEGFTSNRLDEIIAKFETMVQVGTSGSPQERALQSFYTFLKHNEMTTESTHKLFSGQRRPIVLFFTDEHEQSVARDGTANDMPIDWETNPGSTYTNSNCSQFWDPYTYSLDQCISSAFQKMNPQTVMDKMMGHLESIGLSTENHPAVMAVTIQNHNTLFSLRKKGTYNATYSMTEPDIFTYYARAPEIEQLANIAGGESRLINIGEPNFDLVFSAIGNAITQIGTMQLQYPVNTALPFTARVNFGNGVVEAINPANYTVSGTTFQITNLGLLNSWPTTAILEFSYTPLCLASQCN